MTLVGARLAGRFDVRARVRELPGYVELRALDTESDTEVALWCIEPGLHGMVARDTLHGEIERLRGLKHKGLRRLLAIGDDGPSMWIVYPLAQPGPEPRAGAVMPTDQVVAWVKAVAAGLDAAHVEGFSHGRLVPNDVSLLRGNLVVGGVGLWHDVEPGPAAAAWRQLEQFIAPEVRDGAPPTSAADAWSLAMCAASFLIGAPDGGRDPETAVAERHPALARALAAGWVRDVERRCSVRDLALRIADAAKQPAAPASATGTLHGVRTSGQMQAQAVPNVADAASSGKLRVVSMRPGGERAPTPDPDGDADDTARRAKIRPIAETVGRRFSTKAGALGYMAPPRAGTEGPRRGGMTWVVVGAIVVALVAVAVIVAVATGGGGTGTEGTGSGTGNRQPATGTGTGTGAGPVVDASVPVDAALAKGCTPEMIPIGAACIDSFESPGEGRLPQTGISFAEARETCAARQLRLCTLAELRAACAGIDGAAWPYGPSFERGVCNVGTRGMIGKAGSFERCVSAAGVHDLAGNVAEWAADGTIAGCSAVDGGDGRCDAPPRPAPGEGARFADVGFRCCGDR